MPSRLEKDFTIPEREEEEYTIPYSFLDLDEVAAPPPIDRSNDRPNTLENEYPSRSSNGPSNRRSYRGWPGQDYDLSDEYPSDQRQRQRQLVSEEEGYTYPSNFGDLTELAAQSPLESRISDPSDELENCLSLARRGSNLRKSHASKEPFREYSEHNITEFAGSVPAQRYVSHKPRNESNAARTPSSSDDVYERKQPSSRHLKVSRFATELYTVSYLILFSIFGTLARLGLQALTFYPGAPVQTGVLWCNFGGSLVMGFLSEDQALFREHFEASEAYEQAKKSDAEKADPNNSDPDLQPFISAAQRQARSKAQAAVKKTIPLYIGLATGFCGSFTSFSSFVRDAYLALANALPVPVSHTSTAPINTVSTVHRNGGYSFMAICAIIILTVVLCLGALVAGAHLAVALEPFTPRIPSLFARRVVDRTIVFLAWSMWLGAIIMTIWPPDRPGGPAGQATWAVEFWRGDALFALVFAPVGCLLRFYASLHLNGRFHSFPLGTFAVNICGTAVEGMLYDLQHVPLGGRLGCQLLQGLMDGFCGCLTTVSTWVVELKGLRIRHAWIYGAASVGVGVSLMVTIMGSVQWTRGFRPPLCPH